MQLQQPEQSERGLPPWKNPLIVSVRPSFIYFFLFIPACVHNMKGEKKTKQKQKSALLQILQILLLKGLELLRMHLKSHLADAELRHKPSAFILVFGPFFFLNAVMQ